MQKVSLSFGICALAFCAVGETKTVAPGPEEVWASRTDTVTFEVGGGETATQTGVVGVEPGARFEKIGMGTLGLPLKTLVEPGDFDLSVREGSVRLSGGEAPVESKPEAILAKAAFWLDAAVNVIETTDTEGGLGTYVSEWRDCRETATAAPFAYPHGYVRKLSGGTDEIVAMRPRKTLSGGFGKPAVDFQGYGSRCALAFARPADETVPSADSKYADLVCRDVFVVHSITRSGDNAFGGFGFLLGARINAYHPSGAGHSVAGKYFMRTEFPYQFDARWWMNGEEFDASVEPVRLGDYVHDARHYGTLPSVNSLFAYVSGDASSLFDRNGGDLVYEVILFTNALAEAEHTQVRRYLNAKYRGSASVSAGRRVVRLADAAAAELQTDADGYAVVGRGTACKPSGDSLIWNYMPGALYGGVFSLTADDGGSLVFRDDVTLGLARGGVLAFSNVYHGNQAALTSADATTLVKTGDGNARIGAVPAGVSTLDVQGGVLTVARETDAESVSGTGADAVIANPDFQQNSPASVLWINGHRSGAPTNKNGWTCVYTPGWVQPDDAYAVITPYIAGDSNWYMTQTRKDDPTNAWLGMRGGVQMFTDVQVPADGRYEISLDVIANSSRPVLTVWVGPDTNSLQCAGAVTVHKEGSWVRRSVRTPRLTAGPNVLLLRQDVCLDRGDDGKPTYRGAYRLIDNISMKPLLTDPDAFDVPNGDFERYVADVAYSVSDKLADRGFGRVASEGWTYVQPDWTNGVTASGTALAEALFFDKFVSSQTKVVTYFNQTIPDSGTGQLLLGASNALAKTTFRMPAGTWRLRADLAPWRRADLTTKMRPATSAGKVNALVKVGGTTVDLGVVTLTGLRAVKSVWPTSFAVPAGGAEVELSLWVSSFDCAANLDNLAFIPGATAENLVTDGDFDRAFGASGWQGATPGKVSDRSQVMGRLEAKRSKELKPGDSAQYEQVPENYMGAVGGYCGIIADCGLLYQSLRIPEDGRYRLTYYTRERCNGTGDNQHFYGHNAFRLLLATAGGKTNVLDETLVASTNWIRHSALFSAKAGDYTLVVEGLNRPTTTKVDTVLNDGYDKRGFVDGVSIVKTRVTPTFETVFAADSVISVAEGAKLRLGFSGTNKVRRVKLGGKSRWGVISKETYPDYILGEGAFETEPHGAVILFR